MKPLVVFRCIVDGCGKTIAGLFPTQPPGVAPVLGHRYGASGFTAKESKTGLPTPVSPWWIHALPLDEIVGLGIRCRIHGVWYPTADELREVWEAALSGGPTKIGLGQDKLIERENSPS